VKFNSLSIIFTTSSIRYCYYVMILSCHNNNYFWMKDWNKGQSPSSIILVFSFSKTNNDISD